MSVTTISEEEAHRKAVTMVRSELGMYLQLGEGDFNREQNKFVFPLLIQSPKLIRDGEGNVRDARFFSELNLGDVTVDGATGEVNRPRIQTIEAQIRKQEERVELAVRKALVSIAGSKLSHLPFPENQFAPLEDILSHVIVHGSLSMESIEMMDSGRKNDRYSEYVESCKELDLLQVADGILISGDLLIGMEEDQETLQGAVNAAIGRYFEKNIGEYQMINRTLKPYLVIAGRYYRRSLELEQMPKIEEEELRQAVMAEYTGKEREKKLMKMYRYLVHLNDIGILHPQQEGAKTVWVGDPDVDAALRKQSEFLSHYQSVLA